MRAYAKDKQLNKIFGANSSQGKINYSIGKKKL